MGNSQRRPGCRFPPGGGGDRQGGGKNCRPLPTMERLYHKNPVSARRTVYGEAALQHVLDTDALGFGQQVELTDELGEQLVEVRVVRLPADGEGAGKERSEERRVGKECL